ncbi:glutathione synthase [Sporolactobacillus shoreicorticis]|uniref:Glutamate--cysteine ligase n=1 Tax=Sporolactobacillus shoreicorticis TaxID=1923877 RepID=A0ABW5S8N8_9BACL|nr:glutathione synthase [Sporolactobacillus shoreicorticis]MCO7125587.1 glutathione synthase [Sporolactobacillus shoreicorticis]
MRMKKPFAIAQFTACGKFGLERENLRIDKSGSLALTPHPHVFGSKLTNSEITTDFSESQIELVTPVASSIKEMLAHEERLTKTVYAGIGDELLWPLSAPPSQLPPEEQIPIADFGLEGRDKTDYRIYLSKKYGRKKQLYCGIHFNFSFPEDLFANSSVRSRFYLNLVATALRYRYFLVHLLAASPEQIGSVCYCSVRLSARGYKNIDPVYPDYSSPEAYIQSLRSAVEKGLIESPRELYQFVRIKGEGFEDLTRRPDASRVELRIADLNPLYQSAINPNDLYLMHLYLLWCAHHEHAAFTRADQKDTEALSNEAALVHVSNQFVSKMNAMFHALRTFINEHSLLPVYDEALRDAEARWHDEQLSYATRVRSEYASNPSAAMNWARNMKDMYLNPSRS